MNDKLEKPAVRINQFGPYLVVWYHYIILPRQSARVQRPVKI